MTTVIDMPPPQPRVHLRPEDVRLPQSPDEADMALDVCDANLASLENCIAHFKAQGFADQNLRAKLLKWEQRRAEIVYTVTRMNAGLPPIDPAIVDRYDSVLSQLVEARKTIADMEKAARDEKIDAGLRAEKRVEAAQAQAAAWEAKIRALEKEAGVPRVPKATEGEARKRLAGLIAQVEHEKAQREPDREKTRKAVRSLHESHARAVCAIRSMVAAGARLTPAAAQVLHGCVQGMPAGYFDEWMATQYRAFIEAALNSTERNGATCAEPSGTEGA
jgi:chromosome segregation ATPase